MDKLMARLDHAWRHRQDFYTESVEFLKTENRTWHEEYSDGTDEFIDVWTEPALIPARLGHLAADCIYNLRATLDNMISALPGARDDAGFILPKKVYSFDAFQREMRRLQGIPDDALRIIWELQPDQRTHHASMVQLLDGTQLPIGPWLRALDELCNADKHHVPLLALNAIRGSLINIEPTGDWRPVAEPYRGALDGRTKMWTLRRVARQHPKVEMKAYVAHEIRIIEGPYADLRADELLTDLHNIIRDDVLSLFKKWLV